MLGRKMELKRKERLSALSICRFCLSSSRTLHSLYEEDKLYLKILSCISVEIFPSDNMPRFICDRCKHFMNIFFEYKQICRQADDNIMRHVQKGVSLKGVTWPTVLEKAFKSIEDKTGSPIKGSYQAASDTEEEVEENVYNIEMGSGDNAQITMLKKEADGRYQCSFCPKKFLKHILFVRHVESKHKPRCEQCGEKFMTQDDLIYHSAIHATQNLTCPLCMEKFNDVEGVTTHIKSHVNAQEFMCDFCELVFLTNDKLEAHLINAHKEELQQVKQEMEIDDTSMDNKGTEDEDDDENGLRVKEEGGEMVIEINKPDSYMLNSPQEDQEKLNNYSEESEADSNLPEAASDVAVITKLPRPGTKPEAPTAQQNVKLSEKPDGQTAIILKKAEQVKRRVVQKPTESAADRKQKPSQVTKPDNVMPATNDKSLRLLEKELQELKRTNTKNDSVKTPAKPLESLRSRRAQVVTSTPKPKPVDERKPASKPPSAAEKKVLERRAVIKENKEPKETKLPANDKDNNAREPEEEKEEVEKDKRIKKETEKEVKEKETPKSAVKNGTNDKEKAEEAIRRSNRPSKIKDYAKLVRDKPQQGNDDDDTDEDDEEYQQDVSLESRKRRGSNKSVAKPSPKVPSQAALATRKRGRPKKEELTKDVPSKMKKEESEQIETDAMDTSQAEPAAKTDSEVDNKTPEHNTPEAKTDPKPIIMSPSGQTLKQVPVKSLPPGVKPLPLPTTAKKVSSSEVCEMQIGKKVVKVQKIMMTKAEVEAMAKKGLVEFKDGTMVLKQGIKLPPAGDASALKSTLVGDAAIKESPKKETPLQSDQQENA